MGDQVTEVSADGLLEVLTEMAAANAQTAAAADRAADAAVRIAVATEFMFSYGGLDELSAAIGRAIHAKPEERG